MEITVKETVIKLIKNVIRSESHIDFNHISWIFLSYSLRHNGPKNLIHPPASCYLRHFQIFWQKLIVSQKHFWISPGQKKENFSFEKLSSLLVYLFPLLLWIKTENRIKLKKLFIWTTKSRRGGGRGRNTTNVKTTAVMLVIFWT